MFQQHWFVFLRWVFSQLSWNLLCCARHFDLIEILLGLLVIAGISIVFHFDPQYKTGNYHFPVICISSQHFSNSQSGNHSKNGSGNSHTLAIERWIYIFNTPVAGISSLFSCAG